MGKNYHINWCRISSINSTTGPEDGANLTESRFTFTDRHPGGGVKFCEGCNLKIQRGGDCGKLIQKFHESSADFHVKTLRRLTHYTCI